MPKQMEWNCEIESSRARASTKALLERLIEFHGEEMGVPYIEPVEAEIELEAQPELLPQSEPIADPVPPVIPALSSRVWFEIVGEEEVPQPKLIEIKRATSRYFNIRSADIDSQKRTAGVTYPRHIAYYVAKSLTTKSLPEIGRHFGGKDHTTILHGVRKIDRLRRADWRVAYDIAAVEAFIAERPEAP